MRVVGLLLVAASLVIFWSDYKEDHAATGGKAASLYGEALSGLGTLRPGYDCPYIEGGSTADLKWKYVQAEDFCYAFEFDSGPNGEIRWMEGPYLDLGNGKVRIPLKALDHPWGEKITLPAKSLRHTYVNGLARFPNEVSHNSDGQIEGFLVAKWQYGATS